MRTAMCLILIGLQLAVFQLFAQSPVTVKSYDEFVQLEHTAAGRKRYLTEADISGSPYLNKDYQRGYVLTKKFVRYVNVPLRYNIYNDDIEFENAEGKAMAIEFPGNIKEVRIGKAIFVHRLYVTDKSLHTGYFQLMNRGKAEGLIRYRVEFIEAKPAAPYKDPQPPKFERIPAVFYVSLGKKPAVTVNKTKDLIVLLGDHKKELQAFAKEKKIKIRRENDLKQILLYYNSLQKSRP